MNIIESFHPVLQRWWTERIGGPPTPAQEGGWSSIRGGNDTLIAAPTGSGKTLAAFLHSLDELLKEGLERGALPDEVRVIYVSPLKALSADIHRNLAEPRREIRRLTEAMGLPPVRITAATRSGDTPQRERAAMLRTPPHILVTTPESLYLLLTAERSREMLRTVRTVIVDEIHAVIETRRGAHLALTLERLDHVVGRRLQRIGLSATQRPIEVVADFLGGAGETGDRAVPAAVPGARDAMVGVPRGRVRTSRNGKRPFASVAAVRDAAGFRVRIVDEGHLREIDLALELPPSPMEAVMSAEVWGEVYDRVAQLAGEHRTTIVFVNTRRLAERAARELSERLGADQVAAHHGSLAKEVRLDAEERLKTGKLRLLVATASLELGIDIGHVDLVCQVGSPHRIATLLQRVGRSGHSVHGKPKGRLFPISRDDLIECAALVRAWREGELDRVIIPPSPMDVLAQQIVAEAAAEEWRTDDLFALIRRAYPFRNLARDDLDEIVTMLGRGISTHRGRRGALVHHDAVNGRIRGRKGARMLAITSGGAIPDVADYRVVLEPDGTFIGTVNEDFAVESMAGDIFQLGNTSWRVTKVETGVMRVADAHGEPPSIPFWLGEAPARSDELSGAVSRLRSDIADRLGSGEAMEYLQVDLGLPGPAAEQFIPYLAETRRLLGAVPTQETLVLERFFDDGGGMQLVLHAPFGARVNRAWGLALRKKFCQNFNFELQAAATDEGVLLSLGPQHSFPLEEVYRYLNPATLRETPVQAMLDSPIFATRWRWVAMLALTVPRSRNGRRTAPQLQRMAAEDLLASVFPDATACLEHVVGAREIPHHPLVDQAIRDCLEEAMDLPQLEAILGRILAGELTLIARDTTEPSPLASEIVNARVYQFLDDAPLEERRAHAVRTRRALEPSSSNDLAALDQDAIDRVRDEAWPMATDPDELHDALLTAGFVLKDEAMARGGAGWAELLGRLLADRRAAVAETPAGDVWVTAERLPELRAAMGGDRVQVAVEPARLKSDLEEWSAPDAMVELLRSRLDVCGPVTGRQAVAWFARDGADSEDVASSVHVGLLALEGEGRILRGYFAPGGKELEWCDRRLLARIHRYTLSRLRAEIEPVSVRDYFRFLFRWQRVEPGYRAEGLDGLAEIVAQNAGFEAAAGAWEADILPARMKDYDSSLLDSLCLSGRVVWGHLGLRQSRSPDSGSRRGGRPVRSSPITLIPRESVGDWIGDHTPPESLSSNTAVVYDALKDRGASFFDDLVAETRILPTQVEAALGELVSAGLVTADSFSGLRALLVPEQKRASLSGRRRGRGGGSVHSVATAGRWSLIRGRPTANALEARAWALLRRYGVVFRRLLAREAGAPAWRELVTVYRRLEARGEIRGGRFVAGMSGEQFALPEAIGLLRAIRREPDTGAEVVISASDPLNLFGIITPDEDRIPATQQNRILFRDGTAVAVLEGGRVRTLGAEPRSVVSDAPASPDAITSKLTRRTGPPQARPQLRRPRPRPGSPLGGKSST